MIQGTVSDIGVPQRFIGMKLMELVKKDKNQTILGLKTIEKKPLETQFALCIENNGCEDLEKRKFYQILPDEKAAQEGYLRVVDESQEDCLYPESCFIFVKLPRKAQEALVAIG